MAVVLLVSSAARAGGGPENVLLVVNQNSEDSKTIANYYARWRRIPPRNILSIDWEGSVESCSGEQFREGILAPILEAIAQRRLVRQIDYIVYSSDFPWRVDLRQDFAGGEEFQQNTAPIASLTGATYLWQHVQTKSRGAVALNSNWYVPQDPQTNVGRCQKLGDSPTRAFRFEYLWDPTGKQTSDPSAGQRYLLSTMLGVTSGRGNSVEEVLGYLRRSVWADATHPQGAFYFMKNGDVRSATRHACFDEAVALLQKEDFIARVLDGDIPRGRGDVLGMQIGKADFDLEGGNVTIQPGAFCDHLTSLGGVLQSGSGQTPLSELLRHGAAGATGTVAEPFAMQAKFPLPSVQLHYARGASLAEAVFQSVFAPYQLLVVGDALCQPWATPSSVSITLPDSDKDLSGTVLFRAEAQAAAGQEVGHLDFFIDGVLWARVSTSEGVVPLGTRQISDGYHEIRAVAVEAGPLETQGRAILPIAVNNRGEAVELAVDFIDGEVDAARQVRLRGRATATDSITYLHNERVLGSSKGPEGELVIAASELGRGPVLLQARIGGEGITDAVSSRPVWIHVE